MRISVCAQFDPEHRPVNFSVFRTPAFIMGLLFPGLSADEQVFYMWFLFFFFDASY